MAQWRFGTGWYYTIFCYWPTGWWWWNHFSHPCLSFRVSKTLLYLFWNLMKKRILRRSFIGQMVMVVLYNHHDRKSCSKKIVWRVYLLPVVWKIVWLAFPIFPFLFFSVGFSFVVKEYSFFFPSRNVVAFYISYNYVFTLSPSSNSSWGKITNSLQWFVLTIFSKSELK